MKLSTILSVRPAITEKANSIEACELDYEPSLGDILWQYYHNSGLTRADATDAMDAYIEELQRMLNKFDAA